MGQLVTADTWFRTCRTSSFCTVVWQLASFQLTRHIVRSIGDSWASCSGIQTDCLWKTICVLERHLLISVMQNQHSSYSMSSSRNSDKSCHSGCDFFMTAHQRTSHWLQSKLSATVNLFNWISSDLAPSDYFLIRNLKYSVCGTWFIDNESLKIAVEAWFASQNRKTISRCKQLRRKDEKMLRFCRRICQKMTVCVI